MKKIYYSDCILAFCTAAENPAPADQSAWLVIEADEAGGVPQSLKLTNLRQIFETAKFVVLLTPDSQRAEQLFTDFCSQFTPIEAAGGLVRSPQGDTLMIYRHNRWDLPKGKVEQGEALAVAAIREVEEECGITDVQIGLPLTQTYHLYEQDGRRILKRTSWFAMTHSATGPCMPQLEEGITDVRWVAPESLNDYTTDTYHTVREVLAAASAR